MNTKGDTPANMHNNACNNNTYNTITHECLEQHLRYDSLTLLMTESQARFQLGHIPGSQCLSLKMLKALPKQHPVVVYAVSHPSLVTYWAYQLLSERGFGVWLYAGGLRDWLEAGYPLAPLNTTEADTTEADTTEADTTNVDTTDETPDETADKTRKTPHEVIR